MVKVSVKLPPVAGRNRAVSWSAVAETSRFPHVGFEFRPDDATKYPASGSVAVTSRSATPPVPTVANTVPAPFARSLSASATQALLYVPADQSGAARRMANCLLRW